MHANLQEICAVRQSAQARRFDIYAGIHKGVRLLLGDVLVALGRVDTGDTAAVEAVAAHVVLLADFCGGHLAHENAYIHPALERVQAGTSQRIAAEHVEHEADVQTLRAQAQALTACEPGHRDELRRSLYHALSLFAAHNLAHMYIEETEHNAVLWAHYSDEEIIAIHDDLLTHLAPQEAMQSLRWMVPAMSPTERLGLLQGLRASAPPEVFDAVLALARERLNDDDWARLARGLDVPVVPGLVA